MTTEQLPPWHGIPSHEQHFVLVTGANSGVGLGGCQRIIDEFLATRSLSAHLILLPTTRSLGKSRDTVLAIRSHLEKVANDSEQLRARAGGSDYDPATTISRVHILSAQIDLCSLRSVYAFADQLTSGTVTDPTGFIPGPVAIPRLDAAIFNAGIGGWSGVNWLGLAYQFVVRGIPQSVTYPIFKIAMPAVVLDTQKLLGTESVKDTPAPPALGEVFCANLFGHYILAHELLPLLSRPETAKIPPGRVIWTSSVDAEEEHLDLDDLQATTNKTPPYESSKRITDLITLSSSLPGVTKITTPYFSQHPKLPGGGTMTPPRFYLSHPGVVCTPIMPLNWFLFFWYWVFMYLARYMGSPWHTVETYEASCAMSWLALADQEALDGARAERAKWGSSADVKGRTAPKRSEVQGWGWEGDIEDDEALRRDREACSAQGAGGGGGGAIMAKLVGRKWDAETLTEERRARFEEDARSCWTELESLRAAWEVALGRR